MHSYGLATAQLQRLKKAGLRLTIAVDKIAASGGYMMACVADHLVAAPFAIIGSIGVILEMPNFNRLLKKHEIDYEQVMAGDFKRTLTLFGENTDSAREKQQEQINDVHKMFKAHIGRHRSEVDLNTVATGEFWYGQQAMDLKLVDEIATSDDILLSRYREKSVYRLTYKSDRGITARLTYALDWMMQRLLFRFH